VLGDVSAASLGRVDYHEHLFQVSPLLVGDELIDEQRSGAEARSLHTAGIASMIEATPVGLGRNPSGVARISVQTGMHIVATTGAHREEHYGSGHWLLERTETELAQRFIEDVTGTMASCDEPDPQPAATTPAGNPVRAGILKAGIGYWEISEFERRTLGAVAAAHVRTGAPVMVHLEFGSAAFEVLEILASAGVDSSAVVLAHVDRNPDPGLHAELAAQGAYLGYDGAGRHKSYPDSVLIDCLAGAAARGAGERILLGGDVARRTRYQAYGGMPGLAYLPQRFIPRLERLAGAELVTAVLETNPQRLLARF
jgi:predicted metal-dependent phosphotriesterase family hydrolase